MWMSMRLSVIWPANAKFNAEILRFSRFFSCVGIFATARRRRTFLSPFFSVFLCTRKFSNWKHSPKKSYINTVLLPAPVYGDFRRNAVYPPALDTFLSLTYNSLMPIFAILLSTRGDFTETVPLRYYICLYTRRSYWFAGNVLYSAFVSYRHIVGRWHSRSIFPHRLAWQQIS